MVKTLGNLLLLLIAIAWLRSCLHHHDCPLCGTYSQSGALGILQSFTIKQNDPNVRYCNVGQATRQDPNRQDCWDLTMTSTNSRSFTLMLKPDETQQWMHEHNGIALPSDCAFTSVGGDHWLCGERYSVVLGSFRQRQD